jgi:hypothetical protein
MMMFSRNLPRAEGKGRDGARLAEGEAALGEQPAAFTPRSTARASVKKSRPHSWHSTLQRGLARARSRSGGREREKDRAKRASSALHGATSSFSSPWISS